MIIVKPIPGLLLFDPSGSYGYSVESQWNEVLKVLRSEGWRSAVPLSAMSHGHCKAAVHRIQVPYKRCVIQFGVGVHFSIMPIQKNGCWPGVWRWMNRWDSIGQFGGVLLRRCGQEVVKFLSTPQVNVFPAGHRSEEHTS